MCMQLKFNIIAVNTQNVNPLQNSSVSLQPRPKDEVNSDKRTNYMEQQRFTQQHVCGQSVGWNCGLLLTHAYSEMGNFFFLLTNANVVFSRKKGYYVTTTIS